MTPAQQAKAIIDGLTPEEGWFKSDTDLDLWFAATEMLQGGLSEQATTSAIHKIISAMKAEYGE
jgi:hypothetical protein